MKPSIFVSLVIIAILGSAAYSNSFNGKFLWDDRYLVQENSFIKSPVHFKEILTSHIGKGAGRAYSSYRPVQILSYAADYRIWKLNPFGYHLTNLILQILASLLIFCLMDLLFSDRLLSLLTAALFVIHPIHTGAITYISGRADPLAMVFMMASFIFYVKFVTKGGIGYLVLMTAGFILAVFSRENSLILPELFLIAGATPIIRSVERIGRNRRTSAGIALTVSIASVYLFFRVAVFKLGLPHIMHTSTFLQRLPGFFVAITNYIRLLIFPFGLHMEYGDDLYALADPRAVCGIIICLACLAVYSKTEKRPVWCRLRCHGSL